MSRNIYGSGTNYSDYKGSAAELAIFATGQIDGVLPGSQDAGRSPLEALSFANTSLGSGTNPFGGNLNQSLCSDDYFNEIDPTSGFSAVGSSINLSTTLDGDYESSGSVEVGGDVAGNKRVQLYVVGDIIIRDNIIYANNTSWPTTSDIPLIRMYATGNIYIDRNVTEISGLFVSGGTIYTCTNGTSLYDISTALLQDVFINACNKKLTIYGAFTANNVELLRVNGNLADAAPLEAAASANIAEALVFSPSSYI